jgi:hypothetical protein
MVSTRRGRHHGQYNLRASVDAAVPAGSGSKRRLRAASNGVALVESFDGDAPARLFPNMDIPANAGAYACCVHWHKYSQ